MRNNGVGHPKGEPGCLSIKGCNRDLPLPAWTGGWTRNSSCGQNTRCGMLQKRSGTKEGQRGWGRGGSVAAAPGRRWHRCEGPAGSGGPPSKGRGLWQEPLVLSLGLRAVGRGHQGAGPGAEFRPAPARPGCGGGGGEGDGAGKGPAAEPQAAGAGRWNRGSREARFSRLCPPPPSPPGAPAEADAVPKACCAHQAERHLRALLRQQQQRHPAQAPQHGGPAPAAATEAPPPPASPQGAGARDPPTPSQLRQGRQRGPPPLPTSARG